jgi:hypothetical protein
VLGTASKCAYSLIYANMSSWGVNTFIGFTNVGSKRFEFCEKISVECVFRDWEVIIVVSFLLSFFR